MAGTIQSIFDPSALQGQVTALQGAASAAAAPVPRAPAYTYGIGRIYQTNFSNPTLDALTWNNTGFSYGTDSGGNSCIFLTGTNVNTTGTFLTKQTDIKDMDVRVKWKAVPCTVAPYSASNSPAYSLVNILPKLLARYQQAADHWEYSHQYSNGQQSIASASNGSSAAIGNPAETDGPESSLYHYMRMQIIEDIFRVKSWKAFKTTTSASSAAGGTTLTLTSVTGLSATGATPGTGLYSTGDVIAFSDSSSNASINLARVTAMSGNVITVSVLNNSGGATLPFSVPVGAAVYAPEPDWQFTNQSRVASAQTTQDNCDIGGAGFSLLYGGIISEICVTELLRKDANILHNSDLRIMSSVNNQPIFWTPLNNSPDAGSNQTIVSAADRFGITKKMFQVTQSASASGPCGWQQNVYNAAGGPSVFGTRQRWHPAALFPRYAEGSLWSLGNNVSRSATGLGPVIVVYMYDQMAGDIVMNDEGDGTGAFGAAHGYVAGLGPPSALNVAATSSQVQRATAGGYERLEGSNGLAWSNVSWGWTETRFRMPFHQDRGDIFSINVSIAFHEPSSTTPTSGQIFFTEPVFRPAE